MTPSVKKRIREQKRPGRSHFSCTWQDRSVRLAAGTFLPKLETSGGEASERPGIGGRALD